jgi:phage shock protein E
MKNASLFSLLMVIAVTIVSCSNSSERNKINQDTVLSTPGKTLIVDVRTSQEWNDDGHANCTVNFPLDELSTKIETLKAYDSVIVVCRTGNRANTAKEMLEQAGIKHVENKGAWQNIVCN